MPNNIPPGPPSHILALDTSTSTGSIAVGDGTRTLAEVTLRVEGGSSTAIMPAVDRAMKIAGVEPGDLRAVAVSGGPGSFTGVRIAAATAKGISHALDVPVYAYSGLMVCAVAGWGAGAEVCAMFDARRGDVFWGVYRVGTDRSLSGVEGSGTGTGTGTGTGMGMGMGMGTDAEAITVVRGPAAVSVEEAIQRYEGGVAPVFVGEGAVKYRRELEGRLGARVVPDELCAPRAAALLWLVRAAPEMGLVQDPAAWEPDYIRASGAERIAAARP